METVFPYKISCFIDENNINDSVLVHETNNESHLTLALLTNVDEFIKKNPSTKEVTSPIYFNSKGQPNPEGLFSNTIFGITKSDRSGIWGYINLNDYFLHPLIYKKLSRMDSKIKSMIHGIKKYRITDSGEIVEDENGKTGIKFLRDNFDKIKFKDTGSEKRQEIVDFIEAHKKNLFINKLLVLPAFYRDVHNDGNSIGVGEINKLYEFVILAARSLAEADDFGLPTSNATRGRIQELILAIYDFVVGNDNPMTEAQPGLSKKLGLIKRAGQSKTTDFGSRLVITAPQLKVEHTDDLTVDITHSSVPLHSICANFVPFMVFQIKRFFDNEFVDGYYEHSYKGEYVKDRIKDPQVQFSDDRILEELKRFIEGYSNRFDPIYVELENGKKVPMKFKGSISVEDIGEPGQSEIINRTMTWCDIIYIAAVEATKDKHVLITRYPMDSIYNQFPTKIIVSSTIKTDPVLYNGVLYEHYPHITEEDVGSNTDTKFIDTLRISNLMLKAIGGDYDGDQCSVKGVYKKESNEELNEFLNSKVHIIGLDMKCNRPPTNEAIQSIFDLTRVLGDTKLTPSESIVFK